MARKSRKNAETPSSSVSGMKIWRAGLYIRLSVECNGGRGDSLETQQQIMEAHLALYSDIEIVKIYTDNGISGQTFERPAFQRMLADIEAEKIDCVVVKDLSRLGRNAIDTGYYVEKYFPLHHVRFLAVNDQYDSDTADNNGSYLSLPLKNIANEAYAADISRKVRSQQNQAMRAGDFIGSRPPYGYRKAPNNCYRLLVNEDTAPVVRQIFQWAAEGTALNAIVKQLNEANVMTPSRYLASIGLIHDKRLIGSGSWQTWTVRKILENEVYLGDMVQGKTRSDRRKQSPTKPEDWVVVRNTREPLVRRELFAQAQAVRTQAANKYTQTEKVPFTPNIFKGHIFCAHCGRPLHRQRGSIGYFFRCIANDRIGAGARPGDIRVLLETELIPAVLTVIQKQAAVIIGNGCRLKQSSSAEDQKVASMSVEKQRTALHQYVDSMDGLDNVKVEEFVDNGYSGANFERPSVQTMLDLVQKGLINCIIVKDFSCFGRNSVEVEYYLERVFPLYNVRFISINDGYDSDQLRGDTGGINVAFQYLINELYSRDLSVKYKSAKCVKFQRGEYQSKICPYGYRKSSDGRMEPDGEAAETVRLIFELAHSGLGAKKIVRELYERGIPTPAEYKAAHGFTGHDISRSHGIWHESTVARILTDERYTGVYIIGKREVIEVDGHRVRLKEENEWIKIPNHHPAIVSRELYDQVQALRPHISSVKKNVNVYPLRGKVFCGCCGHAMSRTAAKNHAYICRPS